MEYRYSVTHEIQDNGKETCGVEVVAEDGECRTVIQVVHDICSDEKKLEQLVNMCNKLKLDYIHLNDVIDDFLYDL